MPSPQKRRLASQLNTFNRRQDAKRQRREQERKSDAIQGLLDLSINSLPDTVDQTFTVNDHGPTDQSPAAMGPEIQSGSEAISTKPTTETTPVKELPSQTCNNNECQSYKKSLEDECQALRSENMYLKDKINKISFDEASLCNNDEKVKTLTGLQTYSHLITIFGFVSSFLRPKSDLSPFQQLLLTLLRLRMNLSFEFLAYYFGVHATTASRLFNHCINVMYVRLVPALVLWPEREELRLSLPYNFRNNKFNNCVCIIDCFEIFIEKPRNLLASAQSYSSYKSHCTMKYLIGICPQGVISFISNGWGGRTSDKHITENSGFLDKLLPGDLVLADRGFDVGDSVGLYQAELKIPAFTRGKKQLDPIDLENTRGLAAVRIHIERIIGVLRQKYTILQSTVPITLTDVDEENTMHLDKIVSVCCALTNVGESVVPFQ